jgi:3-oxoadipate enol-lactonase
MIGRSPDADRWPGDRRARRVNAVRQVLQQAAAAQTRLVELPGRGVTRVWELTGPPGAETLMLIHGLTFTAELNWAKVFAPLARHFRVVAIDLRGHGDGISAGSRFRLEDCADDIAALAQTLGIGTFVAVGYSMGGMVAQLLYRRHPSLLSGLVLCCTARNVLGSPAEKLAALALPAAVAATWWNPFLQPVSAEILGMALLGPVLVTTQDRVVPPRRQLKLAQAIPGATVCEVNGDHAICVTAPQVFAAALLQACWSVVPGHFGEQQAALPNTS